MTCPNCGASENADELKDFGWIPDASEMRAVHVFLCRKCGAWLRVVSLLRNIDPASQLLSALEP